MLDRSPQPARPTTSVVTAILGRRDVSPLVRLHDAIREFTFSTVTFLGLPVFVVLLSSQRNLQCSVYLIFAHLLLVILFVSSSLPHVLAEKVGFDLGGASEEDSDGTGASRLD